MAVNFHVGQKVVCIDDQERDEPGLDGVEIIGGMDGLRNGAVYTVRDIFISRGWNELQIRLVEIQRIPFCSDEVGEWEAGYDPIRFRPVISKKSDISVFKAILEYRKQPIPA